MIKKLLIILFVFRMSFGLQAQNTIPGYFDPVKSLKERVKNALSLMTVEEKVALCHAQSKFSSAGVPRLGIPEIWMSDGPHDVCAKI